MAVYKRNLFLDAGCAYPNPQDPATYTWSVSPDGSLALAAPVDLTGYTAIMKIRASRDISATTVLLVLTDASGITFPGGRTAGTIQINITAAQSILLPIGQLEYDLLLIPGAGDPIKFLEGSIYVSQLVSR